MTTTALSTLLERAEADRDLVQNALRRIEDQQRRLQQQAEQLGGYRGEYQQRWTAQFARGSTTEIVHCYRSFMTRLDEAVDQQSAQTAQAAAQVERLRQQLVAAELRVASVKKLLERRQLEQRRVLAQREQRQTDEQAQRPRQPPPGHTEPMPL